MKVFVAGLEKGKYEVKENGSVISNEIATDEGGCICFDSNGGSYEISNIDKGAVRETVYREEKKNPINILVKYENKPIYCDVPARIVNDRTLIPFRALFEAMNCTVDYDDVTETATATDTIITIKLTNNSNTAYVDGVAYELDVPAQIIDDRFLIPLRFVSEAMGSKVDWEPFGQSVSVSATANTLALLWGFDNVISIKDKIGHSGEGGDGGINGACDGTLSVIWSSLGGDDGEAWGVFDLGDVYNLEKIYIGFYRASTRTYKFDLLTSVDGENYTPVMTGKEVINSNKDFEEFKVEGTKARYIKYIGRGNSDNLYNSVTEIVFTGTK